MVFGFERHDGRWRLLDRARAEGPELDDGSRACVAERHLVVSMEVYSKTNGTKEITSQYL